MRGDVPVLLGRPALPFACQDIETFADQWSSLAREGDLVNVTQASRHVGIGELLAILLHQLRSLLLLVLFNCKNSYDYMAN